MMVQLAHNIAALDWPTDRLDIQLLLEQEDLQTLHAAQRAGFAPNVRFIQVPPGGPRTKPNALNYGLLRMRGEYVCVYDVEDAPHPNQLKAAYTAFQTNLGRLGCVQAPLQGQAKARHWLAGQWALEYAVHFGMTLPLLAGLGLPVLLGGTSNHFRADIIRALGGWNARNVTEDAELGLRLARQGYRVEMIAYPTREAAPIQMHVWLNQRSRWLKGYMQTWRLFLSQPLGSFHDLGGLNLLCAHLCLGGAIAAALLYLPLMIWVCVCWLHAELRLGMPGWVLLALGLSVGALSELLVPAETFPNRRLLVLTRPFYWPLHSLSAYKALWELYVAPHYWAKTPHMPWHQKTAG